MAKAPRLVFRTDCSFIDFVGLDDILIRTHQTWSVMLQVIAQCFGIDLDDTARQVSRCSKFEN